MFLLVCGKISLVIEMLIHSVVKNEAVRNEKMIAEYEKQNMSYTEAIKKLYASKLYAALEKEDTKVWQYSTPMLYSLLEQEEQTGTIRFPDV